MALMRLAETGPSVGVNQTNNVAAGITEATAASLEKSAGTIVRGKDGQGDIKCVLVGKETINMTVSGYGTASDAPTLGASITANGVVGKIISSSMERSAEDLAKFSANGRALA